MYIYRYIYGLFTAGKGEAVQQLQKKRKSYTARLGRDSLSGGAGIGPEVSALR